MKRREYVTSYCNHAHCVRTGKPVGHACHVLPPAALAAEMVGDYDGAAALLSAEWRTNVVVEHRGLRVRP